MKNDKLLLGIILTLTLVIVGLVVFIISGGKKDKSTSDDKTTTEAQTTAETASAPSLHRRSAHKADNICRACRTEAQRQPCRKTPRFPV